jgi:hypothetical protein
MDFTDMLEKWTVAFVTRDSAKHLQQEVWLRMCDVSQHAVLGQLSCHGLHVNHMEAQALGNMSAHRQASACQFVSLADPARYKTCPQDRKHSWQVHSSQKTVPASSIELRHVLEQKLISLPFFRVLGLHWNVFCVEHQQSLLWHACLQSCKLFLVVDGIHSQ